MVKAEGWRGGLGAGGGGDEGGLVCVCSVYVFYQTFFSPGLPLILVFQILKMKSRLSECPPYSIELLVYCFKFVNLLC